MPNCPCQFGQSDNRNAQLPELTRTIGMPNCPIARIDTDNCLNAQLPKLKRGQLSNIDADNAQIPVGNFVE